MLGRYVGYEKLMGALFALNLLLAAVFSFSASGLSGMAHVFGGGGFVTTFVIGCIVGFLAWKVSGEHTSKKKARYIGVITFGAIMVIGLLICLFHGGVFGFGHLLFTVILAALAVLVEVEALERL